MNLLNSQTIPSQINWWYPSELKLKKKVSQPIKTWIYKKLLTGPMIIPKYARNVIYKALRKPWFIVKYAKIHGIMNVSKSNNPKKKTKIGLALIAKTS